MIKHTIIMEFSDDFNFNSEEYKKMMRIIKLQLNRPTKTLKTELSPNCKVNCEYDGPSEVQ